VFCLEVVTLSGISVSTCESFTPTGSVYKPPKGAKQFNMTSPKFILDRDLALMRASKSKPLRTLSQRK
jgi:hypothetical protein